MAFTVYPNSYDDSSSLPLAVDNVTPVKAEVVNRLRDATLAIEAELGLQPSGTYATVRARLDDIDNLIHTLITDFGALGLSGVLTIGNTTGGHNIIISSGDTITNAAGTVAFSDRLCVDSLCIQELVANPYSPVSGRGTLWLRNDNILIYTDDTGADHDLLSGAETLGATLLLGNTTDGTDLQITNGDSIIGEPGIGAGSGGSISVTGGTGGTSGVGGSLLFSGGAGGSSSGNGGSITVRGGTATDGVGGGIAIIGSAGSGADKTGGGIDIIAGDSTGTAAGSDIVLTPGSSVSGLDGYVIFNGWINASVNRIINVDTPIDSLDAVNKAYIDDYVGYGLAGVLTVGNITDGTDIQLTDGDAIVGDPGVDTDGGSVRVTAGIGGTLVGDVWPSIYDASSNSSVGTATNMELADIVADSPGGTFAPLSMLFDGVDEYVEIGDVVPLQFERTNSFSIAAWVKTSSSGNQIVISKQGTGGANQGWALAVDGGFKPHFSLYNNEGSVNALAVKTTAAITSGAWTHIVATYDGTSFAAGVTIYVNGSPVSTTNVYDSLSDTILSSATVQIARRNNTSFPNRFDGNLSEIAIYDKELSSTEVTDIYNAAIPASLSSVGPTGNLVGWWRMGNQVLDVLSADGGSIYITGGAATYGYGGDIVLTGGSSTDINGSVIIDGYVVDVSGNRIINVPTPIDSLDAVNKDYVDALTSATAGEILFRLSGEYSGITIPAYVDSTYTVTSTRTLNSVTLGRRTAGTSGTTRVDFLKNGGSIFATDGNKPQVTAASGDAAYNESITFTDNTFAAGDFIDIVVDSVETYLSGPPEGPEGIVVILKFA